MRLALVVGCVGLLLAACSDDAADGSTMTQRDAQQPTSGVGGAAGAAGGTSGTGSTPSSDAGRPGPRAGAGSGAGGSGGGGVITGHPEDAGTDGGTGRSRRLLAHAEDGCVITRDGTVQCWDQFGSAAGSPLPGTFVELYGGPADQLGRRCMLDSAGAYSCQGGAPRPPAEVTVTDMAISNSIACGL